MDKGFSINATLAKAAAVPVSVREDNKMQAARLLVSAPLAMAALGAMLRGAGGLRDMFTASSLPEPSLIGTTQTVPLPRLSRPGQHDEDLDPSIPSRGRPKMAEGPPPPVEAANSGGQGLAALPNYVADNFIYPLMKTDPGQVRQPLEALMVGDGAHNTMGVPAAWAALPLGMAGGYAGFKGMDAFLDARRKQQRKREIDLVKQQYIDALQGKYASDEDLNADFDKVAEELLEKDAEPHEPLAPPAALERVLPIPRADHYLGGYAGFNLAAALASAMAGGYLGYQHANKTSRRKLMAEALRRRAAMHNDPAQPIYADVVN
jgi:hypothetical protein